MIADTATAPRGRAQAAGGRQDAEIVARLRKATGQLTGVTAMYQDGRYCIDVLDQLSAVSAAIDAVALLVLEGHVHTCVRDAIGNGDAEDKAEELLSAVRRYVRSR
jgi:CsoR family transcriptional regulator, copper-sensing transcriptional repressor